MRESITSTTDAHPETRDGWSFDRRYVGYSYFDPLFLVVWQLSALLENKTFASIPAAFARAVVLYEYRCGMRAQMSRDSLTSDPALKTELNRAPAKTVILFVVQDMERNISDQRFLEFELLMRYGIKSVRKTLEELGRIKEKVSFGSPLVVDGAEVAVAYFRAGYAPDDYVDEVSWDGREIVEMSRVIKCPDIATHLLGTKKVILDCFLSLKQVSLIDGLRSNKYWRRMA